MTLKDVIQSKPTAMITCRRGCKVSDAIKIMDEKNVGSMLIMDDDNKLVGIFTERDIMHCAARKIAIDNEIMGNIMTQDPVTLDLSTNISVGVKVMSEKKIRHLPVTENEKIIGMISYRDLVSFLLPEVIFLAEDIY